MKRAVEWALEEDLGSGDCTSMSSVPEEMVHEGFILAKEDGVLAGVEVARHVFERVDSTVSFEALRPDGAQVAYGEAVIKVKGPARSILSAERLALNFMQRMSGVATMAHRAQALLEGTGARVLDTRKTTPVSVRLRNGRWPWAAAPTTGWASTTWSSSKTTTWITQEA